ncbi:indole-3-glycerol phosphate synthase TrpC [Bacillus taeanensis]|uniref:Indole-3-glycerol phosphate synthase n=1 Tax=Bacillus taeanensis TaxID=273032 RepID=A0A366XWJ7_9BACI|nr:indole-3-glycerol phosphate synthase TrpC [Bacillus taeanensis]RBW70277.1 indole-3-glycerol phosphate synthase TrpC [Bacillus taeanensis]
MLNKILEVKQQEVIELKLPTQQEVEKRSFYEALSDPNRSLGLIAEVKRASPSKGIINDKIDPVEVAKSYQSAGADAISVLTDQQFFKGHIEDLIAVKQAVNIPVLRKDFIVDQKQIEESSRIGADVILLIVAALGAEKTFEFYKEAERFGLECLVEVHGKEELLELLKVFTPKVIGVNNRNLKTFQTSIEETEKVIEVMPKDALLISESGIHNVEDIRRVKALGARGVLVGEALMKAETPELGINHLFGGERVGTSAT